MTIIPRKFREKNSLDDWKDFRTVFLSIVNRKQAEQNQAALMWGDVADLDAEIRESVADDIEEEPNARYWPDEFNALLRPDGFGAPLWFDQEALFVCSNGPKFAGASDAPNGTNNRPDKAVGWINPVWDQDGIPGWYRIELVNYSLDENHNPRRDKTFVWEGVVIPGGRMILGRWRYPYAEAILVSCAKICSLTDSSQ